jgi:serine/threonine-protein kinase
VSTHPDHDRDAPLTAATEPEDGDATPTFAHASTAAKDGSPGSDDTDTDQTVISNELPIEPVHAWASLRPRELGHLLEGRRLDHFQLEEFIGGGGMGAVFRAHDTVLGRTVAVKVLATGAAENDETRQRFHNEAQSAARLDHPNIARVHYVGEDQGFNYIVFEFLQGKNVRDLVADIGPLPLPDALRFTLQIAEALAHAWQRDIVHRDIKPSNVLATPEGQVKLVDMGLARLRDVAASTEDLTASGMTLGTFDYISPEQARDPRHADSRSDIYSLGCTLYFMLCGRPPFQGGTAVQKLLMHQSDAPPSPRELRPDLPAGVEQLLSRMLAKSPEERFQNPAELIAAVTTLADQLGIAVYPTTTVQLTVSGQGTSWLANSLPWLAPAAVLLICVFVIDYVDRSASSAPRPFDFPADSSIQVPQGSLDDDRTDPSAGPSNATFAQTTIGATAPSGTSDRITVNGSAVTQVEGTSTSTAPPAKDSPTSAESASPSTAGRSFMATTTTALKRLADWIDLEESPLLSALVGGSPTYGAADASPDYRDRFIVNRKTGEAFASLDEALERAISDDVLEFRKGGEIPLDPSILPLRLVDRNITLRGRDGYRPVLRIVTSGKPRPGPRPSAFTIEDGTLRLEGIDLELEPELDLLGGWGLIELRAGAAVELDSCRITLRGRPDREYEMRDHDDVFVILGDPSAFPNPATRPTPLRIDLRDVVVRGGDTLVSVEGDARADLNIDNGLFVLRGFLYDGSLRNPASRGASRIHLAHVTADLGEGALKVIDISRDAWVTADVNKCIFIGRLDAAFVEQIADDGTRAVPLDWRGDINVYQNWGLLFRQQSIGGEGLRQDFLNWQRNWAGNAAGSERNSSEGEIVWLESAQSALPFDRVPADYVVDPIALDLLPGLGGDRTPPGLIIESLPSRTNEQRTVSDAR